MRASTDTSRDSAVTPSLDRTIETAPEIPAAAARTENQIAFRIPAPFRIGARSPALAAGRRFARQLVRWCQIGERVGDAGRVEGDVVGGQLGRCVGRITQRGSEDRLERKVNYIVSEQSTSPPGRERGRKPGGR